MTLHIQGTERTPEVQLMTDPLSLTIQGESFPEDVAVFYGPVIIAINALSLEPKGPLNVTMAMVYINSSSIKALYRIFEGVDAYRTCTCPKCATLSSEIVLGGLPQMRARQNSKIVRR